MKPRLEDPDGIDGLLDEQLHVAADKASLTSAMAAQAAFAELMSVHPGTVRTSLQYVNLCGRTSTKWYENNCALMFNRIVPTIVEP